MSDIKELLDNLNLTDECSNIEAKKGSSINRSILETVCAFSNEPAIGGGYILLGLERESETLFSNYKIVGVDNPDKLQLDLSSQCASMFNVPIRPEIRIEKIEGKNILNIFIPELPEAQKPVYFKNESLPRGAYRRIGSSDQRCTDDDMFIFYNKEDSFDSSVVVDSSLEDVSEEAIALYRRLRERINPYAEELNYSDTDLLYSIGCVKKEKEEIKLTYAGLLLFGKRQSHRRLLPMVRVDYIRVPGNTWVEDPENRFTTIDMRGSLLEMVQRIFNQVTDDLPNGFLLPEGELQAQSIGLPAKVLREAIVNALIHRSYRENQPVQIIRYRNRLEITNPGFSLKPEEYLGEPGSKNRNPNIAAVFHETNLAETKGSGIKSMRDLMEKAKMLPPTFESDHSRNHFTIRLLLHHFLGEEDILWLSSFDEYNLNESQKRAIIFTREVGAIDNSVYRQINYLDKIKASFDLRDLKDKEIFEAKGKGKATYYIPGINLHYSKKEGGESEPVQGESEPALRESEPVLRESEPVRLSLIDKLSPALKEKLKDYSGRVLKKDMEDFICELCDENDFSISQLSILLNKRDKYLLNRFIKPLREMGRLKYTIPDMPNHPQQTYRTIKKG